MIWHLTICWQSDLLLHLCSTLWIVVYCHYGAFKKLKFADSGSYIACFPNPLLYVIHIHKHYINGSQLCATGAQEQQGFYI